MNVHANGEDDLVTIKDIADAAGVSIGTVDRILHNRGRFSEKTAAKVMRIVEETGYTPNMHARGLKKTRTYTFAAVLPRCEQDAGYWKMVEEGVVAAGEQLKPFCEAVRIIHFDRYSAESCLNAVDEAAGGDRPADGLLIAPVLPEAAKRGLSGKGLPFLFIDTDIPAMSGRISYIGQDSARSGRLSAKLMGLLLAKAASYGGGNTGRAAGDDGTDGAAAPTVLIVDPPGDNFHLHSRIDGFAGGMAEFFPEAELLRIKAERDDEAEFHRLLKEAFGRGRPSGIFAANSSVYYAASFLAAEGGAACGIPLIGYDLIPGRETLIESGIIDFILTQQPQEQARRGIISLYESIVLGKTVESEVIIPMNIITKENLRTFAVDSGSSEGF